MKTTRLTGLSKLCSRLLSLAAVLLAGGVAEAHLSYSGRDFGAYSGLTNATRSITNQTVTGNYGWADAADGILGDSHRGRAFRFHLDNQALVELTVSANSNATASSIGGFIPAYSIYSGLAAIAPFLPTQTALPSSADHDFSDASVAWRTSWVQQNLNPAATDESPTDGSWNALGDWKIGGDGDLPGDFTQLSAFTYKGSAADASYAGTVSGSFLLPAGDYTIMIGGNVITNKSSDTALAGFGIAATLSVTPAALGIVQKVFVSCPLGTATNWVLQSVPAIYATNWTTVTNAAVVVDGQNGFVLDRTADQKYFRLNVAP